MPCHMRTAHIVCRLSLGSEKGHVNPMHATESGACFIPMRGGLPEQADQVRHGWELKLADRVDFWICHAQKPCVCVRLVSKEKLLTAVSPK